jgi:hypothetical protein
VVSALLLSAAGGAARVDQQVSLPSSLPSTTGDPTTSSGATTTRVQSLPPTAAPTSPPTTDGSSSTGPSTTVATTQTAPVTPPPGPPPEVRRSVPAATPATPPPPTAAPPPWAWSIKNTTAGYVSTDIGCAANTGAEAIDAFFAQRAGPLIGSDYQHVVPLGGSRYAWFFQDAFIDPPGSATRLDQAHFAHNIALIQDGACFTLLHRGSADAPQAFEPGNGGKALQRWFWPKGGETAGNRVSMFWVEMVKDPYEPDPGDGLGWHPVRTWLAVYDATTLARLSFTAAPNPGVDPIYGYSVASDGEHTYLFGNTFEQNLTREGGFFGQRHSATAMYVARVPLGQLSATPEYRSGDGWTSNAAAATPIAQRYWAENPMQPRFIDGQWVAATKVDGYWGEQLAIDVANQPWGPWYNVVERPLAPRGNDPSMNTYHAHLLPWRASNGSLIVTVSQNARDMVRGAYPNPHRYRIGAFVSSWPSVPDEPPPPLPVTTTTTTLPPVITTTTSTTSTTTSTTEPPTTSTTTTTTAPSTTVASTGATTTVSTRPPDSTPPDPTTP